MLYYGFSMLNFMCLFIIMSISVKLQLLWRTVMDMRLSKCSIVTIIYRYMFVDGDVNGSSV